MPNYLVEVYLPRAQIGEAHAAGQRARAAVDELAREGTPIRYVSTTFLPDDETCFHLFEAASVDIVEEATRRSDLRSIRIVPAIEASAAAGHDERT